MCACEFVCMYMITNDLKPSLCEMLKKKKKKALVKIREAAWFETDVAIEYPKYPTVICFPTAE